MTDRQPRYRAFRGFHPRAACRFVCAWLTVAPLGASAELPGAAATFARFAGDWALELETDPATFGDRGGTGQGGMSCAWGPLRAWMDCTMEADYEGLGAYALKIVLYPTSRDDRFGAFVTNSLGGGRLYTGHWQSPDELVYHDAWVDPERQWPHQRTTYRFDGDGRLSFEIEVSRDGELYLPHSGGSYRRAER